MLFKIKVEDSSFQNIKVLQAKLRRAVRRIRKRSDLMRDVRQRQAKAWLRNFDAEGGRYGGWEPLAKKTIRNRKWLGYGEGPMLKRSRTLRSIVSNQSYNGIVDDSSVTWNFVNEGRGSDQGGYPLYHTLGTKHIPPRVFWDLNEKDVPILENAGRRWLKAFAEEVF